MERIQKEWTMAPFNKHYIIKIAFIFKYLLTKKIPHYTVL